jgi:DNA polymerase-1
MKLAMIQIDHAIIDEGLKSRMLLQVHDELVFEVAPGELDELKTIVVDRMSNAVKLSVPLDVHVGIGSSWDKAGH